MKIFVQSRDAIFVVIFLLYTADPEAQVKLMTNSEGRIHKTILVEQGNLSSLDFL